MRLIDADALMKTMRENSEGNEGWYGDTWAFMRDVEHAPTIDAVPVVRCKDCRWWNDGTQMCGITISATPYGHCHDGERKDNEID